jgi:hypothetical protein
MFLRKYKDKQLFGEHNILTEVVSPVTQLPRNKEVSF